MDRAYIVAVSKARHDPDLIRDLPAARVVGPAPSGWAEAVTDFLCLVWPPRLIRHGGCYGKGRGPRRKLKCHPGRTRGKGEGTMKRWIPSLLILLVATGAWAGPRRQGAGKKSQGAELSQGVKLYKEGNYAQAASVLKKVVGKEPKNEQALTYYGLSLVQSGKAAESVAPLRSATTMNDKNAEAHYGLGLAYGYLKKYPEAIQSLERTVELQPNNAYARYHLALAYNQTKRIDLAVLHLHRFLELAPNAPEAPQVNALLSQLRR